jgi:cobalt-zinc-cadmium efflux system outer membrane protein
MESHGRMIIARGSQLAKDVCLLLLCSIVFPSVAAAEPDTPVRVSPPALEALIQEALAQSPMITSARKHWQALTKVPIQVSTLPDPVLGLQQLTVGSPQPFSGYEASDFYYTGFGVSQDIPGPGKLRLRAKQADKEAEGARDAFLAQQRQVVEQVRETYFNLFYLRKMLDSLHGTRSELDRVAETTEAQYHVAMAQQQDVLKAQLAQTDVLKDLEMNQEEFQQGQANLKAILGREEDSANIEIGEVTPTDLAISDSRLRQLALTNSPTLQQAHAMEEQSDAALAIAKRDYVPDFNVGYMYQKTGPGFHDYYMLSLGVKVPLYFWRKQTPAIEQASLEKESVLADSYSKRLSVLSDLQNQVVALRTNDRVLKLYTDGLIPQAEETLTSATAAYRVGKVDFQTLLSAVVDVLRIKQEYLRSLADHEIAIAKIQQTIGEQQ